MHPGLPDRNLFGHPGLNRPDGKSLYRNTRNNSPGACTRILHACNRVKIDYPNSGVAGEAASDRPLRPHWFIPSRVTQSDRFGVRACDDAT